MKAEYHGVIFSGCSSRFLFRSLGPYRLRTVLASEGYRIKVIDFADEFSTENLRLLIDTYVDKGCLFIAFTTTFTGNAVFKKFVDAGLLDYARARGGDSLNVIVGGALTLTVAHDTRPYVDYFISGYADVSFPVLLNYLTGKTNKLIATKVDGSIVVNSNEDYPLLDSSDLTTRWLAEDCILPNECLPIETARGCIFRCSFCAYPLNGKKKLDYLRSTENFLAEVRRNYYEFGVRSYGFMDDTYNDSDQKMKAMHAAIMSLEFKIKFSTYIKPELLNAWPHHCELLVESGIEGAAMGLESFHGKARRAIRKGTNLDAILGTIGHLQEIGRQSIAVQATFIAGLPFEPIESMFKTHEWLKQNTSLINNAVWCPLVIMKKGSLAYQSEIDRDPGSYGYKINGEFAANPNFLNWENEFLDHGQACKIVNEFERDYDALRLVGGWWATKLRHLPWVDVQDLIRRRALWSDFYDPVRSLDFRAKFLSLYLTTQLAGSPKPEMTALANDFQI